MSIKIKLFIFLVFILLLTSSLFGEFTDSLNGRIEAFSDGVYKGKHFITCKLWNDDRGFTLSIDTGADTTQFKILEKKANDAYHRQAKTTIYFDNLGNLIDLKIHSVNMVTHKTRSTNKIRYWKKPTDSTKMYNVGDSVLFGQKFVSLINNNIWSPREAPNYWDCEGGINKYMRTWETPAGAHDCYNIGTKIQFKGNQYESIIDGNVWSPDEYRRGWKYHHRGPVESLDSSKLVDHSMPEPQTRTTAPKYSQPSGAHDAYKRGDVVSLNGTTYRSIIDTNVWSPEVAQSYWEVLSSDTRTTVREWNKPTGVHDCYHKGYKMLFNGKTYESLMNSNVWSPDELPSSWKVVE